MNASTLYLVLAALGFGVALSTNLKAQRLGPFVAPYWLFAWLTGELAPHAIVAHALMAIAFITAGALDERTGVAALVLTFASIALLARAHLRGVHGGAEARLALAPLGLTTRDDISSLHGFPRAFDFANSKVERVTNIAYGESLPGDKGERNLLDVIRPRVAKPGRQTSRAAADSRRRMDRRRQEEPRPAADDTHGCRTRLGVRRGELSPVAARHVP